MVAITQAIETAIAVIIFVFLVMLFFMIFGNSECEGMSDSTAAQLADAVNKVVLEDGIQPWTGGGVPGDDDTDYYEPVAIRLCEVNSMNGFAAQFMAQQPTYMIVFESFPEGTVSWHETQPWSGGAVQAVLEYSQMRWGLKALTFGGKLTAILVRRGGGFVKNVITKYSWALLGRKLTRALDYVRNSRIVKWFMVKLGRSNTQTTIADTADDFLNPRYMTNNNLGLTSEYNKFLLVSKKGRDHALVAMGAIEGVFDYSANAFVPIPNKAGKYIVNEGFRDFMINFVDNMGEDGKVLGDMLQIPSRFPKLAERLSSIKDRLWRPLKGAVTDWWHDSSLKRYVYDAPRELYRKIRGKTDDAKNAFNKIFNYGNGMTDPRIISKQAGAAKEYAMRNSDKLMKEVVDNFDDPKIADFVNDLQKVTGKVYESGADITQTDIISYINKYNRWENMQDFVEFLPREQLDLRSNAYKWMGGDIKDSAEKLKKGDISYETFIERFKPWDDLEGRQSDLVNDFSKGYTRNGQKFTIEVEHAKDAYEYARLRAAAEGIFDAANSGRTNWLANQADEIETALIREQYRLDKYVTDDVKIIDYIMKNSISDSSLDKFPLVTNTLSYGWQRLKRGVYLDLNRIGGIEGAPSLAPYNLVPGAYTAERVVEKETEIKEGGCASNSICRIVKGRAEGPTETARAYLLDRKVPEGIEVKLWRENPDIGVVGSDRTVAGVNTILMSIFPPQENPNFYVVSPCFAIAKVWKEGSEGPVYVEIDKSKKCDVSGCNQLTTDNVDTPNYCYASEEFVWGESDEPNQWSYVAAYFGCVFACEGGTIGLGTPECIKTCKYSTIGALLLQATAATQEYRSPSWERQDTGWGYWNYQKAEDVCDLIDMVSSIGGGKSFTNAKGLDKLKAAKGLGEKWDIFKQLGKGDVAKFVGGQFFNLNDVCYSLLLMGDTSLSWPVKTPAAEVWRKGAILGQDCMQQSAGSCVWLRKCTNAANDCPIGWYCDMDANICRKGD
ncbi:MAG: hypothetical protein V1818_03775 [Candidatus Aenigmatarchaeota archaeon]